MSDGWDGPQPIAAVRDIEAYTTPHPPGPIDLELAGNEGRAPPASVLDALAALDGEALRRYPDLGELRSAIADRHGVSPERVLVTAGGDQAIDLVSRAFLTPGQALCTHTPSFVMIERAARFAGGDVVAVPWHGGAFPVDELLAHAGDATPLVILVSPNNPTGATIDEAAFRQVVEGAAPALVVVDHAYVEFTETDLTAVAAAYDNAAVIRTLSKAYGLAGARVGYLLGHPRLIEYLRRLRGPYPLSVPSIAAATARLEDDVGVAPYVDTVRSTRSRLEACLDRLGVDRSDSEGNFVLGRFPDGRWAFDALAGLGIRTRLFPDRPALADALRITVPDQADDGARVEAALEAAVAPEAILLDMDGVIADVSGSYRQAIVRTAEDFGVAVTPDDIEASKQAGDANDDWELTHKLVTAAGVDAAFEDVKAAFEAHYLGEGEAEEALFERERLVDGGALDALAERRPLAVVTGRPRRDADRFLGHHGIADRFDALVCKEDAPSKPSPEPVAEALDRLGCSRAWLVGDTPDDIRAARAAGVVPIGVVPPNTPRAAVAPTLGEAGAARVLDGLDDVVALLDSATAGR